MFKKLTDTINISLRNTTVALGLAGVLMAGAVVAGTSDKNQITNYADDLEWIKGGEGLHFALAWGDWNNGEEYGMVVKIDAGVTLPRHSHTADYHGMTIQGTWVHSYEKGDDRILPPGSYAFQAGGEGHGDRCEGTIDCMILIHQHGARDFALEE